MLQERLNKIREYFVGMEMYNGLWVVRVKYRPKWSAYPPDNGSIKVVSDENEDNLWWYCANDESVEIDTIINLIEETIQTNMEAIKKVELFKLKAGELKAIFSDENTSLKKLQTLRFVFDNSIENISKPEPKKKVVSKKELITKVDDEIKEHNVFSSEMSPVEEPVIKKRSTRKKAPVEKENVVTSTPDEMTKAEIDDLRG